MNRRGFLALLAGAVLDPERLLWVPGRKVISIPAPTRTMEEVKLFIDAREFSAALLIVHRRAFLLGATARVELALAMETGEGRIWQATRSQMMAVAGLPDRVREEAGSGEETVGFVS